jgi:hypothetical protein
MKPFAVNLISSVLAFACGFATASSTTRSSARVNYISDVTETLPLPPPPQFSVTTSTNPRHEAIQFGDGLTLVTNEVKLKSERLRYDIDVRYPQIVGAEDDRIAKFNQQIKDLTTKQYERSLYPTQAEYENFQMQHPHAFNRVNMDYEIGLATGSFLSIYLDVNSYTIRSGNWSQHSLTLNYDLSSKKELKLSDLFQPGSKYLEFISDYCRADLSKGLEPLVYHGLAPDPKNFTSWLITSDAIRFKFDECKVFRCAAGPQFVDIKFAEMDKLLQPGIVEKFQFVYR